MSNPSIRRPQSRPGQAPEEGKDVYSQTSPALISKLAQTSPRLRPEEETTLQGVANAYEEDFQRPTWRNELSQEEYEALERLPTWLRAQIQEEGRWDAIKSKYGSKTARFLHAIANQIEREHLRSDGSPLEDTEQGSVRDQTIRDEIEKFTLEGELKAVEARKKKGSKGKFKPDKLRDIVFRVGQGATHWKRHEEEELHSTWDPYYIKNASLALQNALSMNPGEDGMTSEEEEQEESMVEVRPRKSRKQVSLKLPRVKRHKRGSRRGGGGAIGASRSRRVIHRKKIQRKKAYIERYMKHRNKEFSRDHFKKYSHLFRNSCGPIRQPYRSEEFHFDERFHTYVCALISWKSFKFLIILTILANALCMALETTSWGKKSENVFEILDSAFLAIYTTEFLLKVYAYPREYWKSGFNKFDFIIVVTSLIIKILDFLKEGKKFAVLRVLRIIRTLRILRSVSLSAELQVLMTALVATVKTHVLGVILLLVFLMYIMSLVAYYLFADTPGPLQTTWSNISYAMLRMLAFVTLDGWTDLLDMFYGTEHQTLGQVFCLVCVAFGNFMFSNIFIAVIINNISEATEKYREMQASKKGELVRTKKESVFKRQKLDLKLLLAHQSHSKGSKDYFQMAFRFQDMLKHDDLVTLRDTITSPLWLDCVYQTYTRIQETSNILLNLHRESAETLLELKRLSDQGKYKIKPIRRERYDRLMKLKAKLALIKNEILKTRTGETKEGPKIFTFRR